MYRLHLNLMAFYGICQFSNIKIGISSKMKREAKMREKGCLSVVSLVICGLGFWLSACGGGGGDGHGAGGGSPDLTPASMDENTAANVLALILVGGEISDMSWSWIDDIHYRSAVTESDATRSVVDWALWQVNDALFSGSTAGQHDESRSGSSSKNGSCGDSGTYQVSLSWNGPNNSGDICDISDAKFTATYHNCQESGERINGTMRIEIHGDACAPVSMSLALSSFSLYDNTNGHRFKCDDLDITMTDIEMTGDMADISHVRSTMNGDVRIDSISMEYYQYTEDVTVNGSKSSTIVSGSMSGGCFDGWVALTTLSPILIHDYNECLRGGSIQLSGTSDMTVVLNGDGSLTIGEKDYASCMDLPAI
jgi:hypothetical protein